MSETGDSSRLGRVPSPDSPVETIAAFLTFGYGLPDGYYVSRIVRHGGRSGTSLDVFIRPPGKGEELRIHYERESDCTNHIKLRAQAAADTKGLTRGSRISGPKAALAMYEALCSMADHFEATDRRGETWEWVQQLHQVAAVTSGTVTSYQSLRRLQEHDYSKRLVQDPPKDKWGEPARALPLLLVDIETGFVYVTARHMAVFLRYDLGLGDAGDDDRILTRLIEIGGARQYVEQWDSSGRDRQHKVRLVLYRLPEDQPTEGPGEEHE